MVKFIQQAYAKLNMQTGDVLAALKWVSIAPITNIEDFSGTKEEAWGACVAYHCGYDLEEVVQFIPDEKSPGRIMAEKLIDRFSMPF
jgi:hypothetical protein